MKIDLARITENSEERSSKIVLTVMGDRKIPESGIVCVQAPEYAVPFCCTEVKVDRIAENEVQKVELTYHFSCGGRFVFYAWEKGSQRNTLCHVIVLAEGAGWYSGNTHSHSTYSDGKSTLEENRKAMMDCGQSFIYSTDHNTTNHFEELLAYAKAGEQENFLHLPGWEFTTKFGHAIAYRSGQTMSTDRITERNNLSMWQSFVDDENAAGAFVYLAHPYEAPRYEFGDDVLCGIKGMVGVEAWNGYNYHALAYQNRKNFEIWDALNRRGDRHYYGNSVSDAHTMKGQGSPYIKGYLEKLDRSAVEELLMSGKYFGSNGPEIRLSIGEAGMGETCRVETDDKNRKTKKRMVLDVFDPLGDIQEIRVYRGHIDGEYTVKPNTKAVLEFYPIGEDEKRNFVKQIYLDVAAGEFYRAEVITGLGVTAYLADPEKIEKGFAFTNPVWIESR